MGHSTIAESFASLQNHWVKNISQAPHYILSGTDLQIVERKVQTVKNTPHKCGEQGEDLYLGILSYRTTPVDQ